MPKGKKPTVSFGKAARSPSRRDGVSGPRQSSAFKVPMNKPKGHTEIAEYVEEQRELTEKNTRELIQEFQEDFCDHPKARVVISSSPEKKLLRCPDCGHIKVEAAKR